MSQTSQSFRTIGNVSTAGMVSDSSFNLANSQSNAIVGSNASTKNTTGRENTVVGTSAMAGSTGGGGLVAVGFFAAPRLISGAGAVVIGDRSAPLLLSGYDSVVCGFSAGSNLQSADGCVMIGPNSGTTTDNNSSLVDDVVIGSHSLLVGTGATCVGARCFASGDASVCMGYSNFHSSKNGVTIGSFCSNTSPHSIMIGNGLVLDNAISPSDNLVILAGSGMGHINIQNLLTGGVDRSSGTFDLRLATPTGQLSLSGPMGTTVIGGLKADSLKTPKVTLIKPDASHDSDVGPSWDIALSTPNIDRSWADLLLSSSHGTQVTFCDDFVTGVLNFTAQHRCLLAHTGQPLLPGSIVIASGQYRDLGGSSNVTVDEAVPIVSVSATARDPRVFGVVSCLESDDPSLRTGQKPNTRTFRVGSMGFSVPLPLGETSARVVVNSGGEGGILVCGANGPIRNGDLLVSSHLKGLGMRQGDDIVRSCTVAKATCSCDFVVPGQQALIGCVYMC